MYPNGCKVFSDKGFIVTFQNKPDCMHHKWGVFLFGNTQFLP